LQGVSVESVVPDADRSNDAASGPIGQARSFPAAAEGERRQVAVLFADLVGFTPFSERSGEEAAYALMQQLLPLLRDSIEQNGGSVEGHTGDGVKGLFGAEQALEDAPLRACRAALQMQQRLAGKAAEIEARFGIRPLFRVGLNTGPVVVGRVDASKDASITALGDAVNFASRLQTLAEPGTVLLSEAVHRLVEGLVEASFAGVRAVKGKAEPQKVYRLDSIRQGATRFGAAVGRGLTTYIGRESELAILQRGLVEARNQLRVIDIVAEPGMGKSRLLHELRRHIDKERVLILAGSCSPDGQQTPFLPFIEMIRGSFGVAAGEAENEVARKLEAGLTQLGLNSLENRGLLFNLLGLKSPESTLTGLDGVLIGLRTRELLQRFLGARCRLSPVVILIEDLHWIDSVSEEVLGKIIGDETKRGLLLLHTRRPEYRPAWLHWPAVTNLWLEPLPAHDIRRLVEARLGVEALPEALAREVAEKADGNALFAEEIVSFLAERGVLRVSERRVDFDSGAMASALPASVQSLLTARVDRLAPQDRALLQAAAVIGRRFGSDLLSVVAVQASDIDARLAAMHDLDLIRPEGKSGDYAFKHALVRDALYYSLLTRPRIALHLKIAEEIERRSGNRLGEVTEILAHHYGQTDRTDKAFTYLAMAGAKSLGVYSLDEADSHFASAVALLDKYPDCANDKQLGEMLVGYTLYLNVTLRHALMREIVKRFMARLDRLGGSHERVLIQHHFVLGLLLSGRYREAEKAQIALSAMAARLHDVKSTAYALASAIHVSTFIAPMPVDVFEALSREAIAAASNIDDSYLQCFLRFVVGWEEFHRGRMAKAHAAAAELMAVGRSMSDPRSIGLGTMLHAWVALTSDDYATALNFAETSIGIACTPWDREGATLAKLIALVLLRRPEAFPVFRDFMDHCRAEGWGQFLAGVDGVWGVALVLRGEMGAGLRWMKQSISTREREGYRAAADWCRLFLSEIYIEIISGNERPPAKVLARNLHTLAAVMFTAERRVHALIREVRQNPRFDPNGYAIGRCDMIMGLLYKAKKKRALAVQHLTEAKRIVSQFGPTPMLTRIETALAELA
jgi:class 3 adenylate cyclase